VSLFNMPWIACSNFRMTAQIACIYFKPLFSIKCLQYPLTLSSCLVATRAGIYKAWRIYLLPALLMRSFFATLESDSTCRGSKPAWATYCFAAMPPCKIINSASICTALASGMLLIPMIIAKATLSFSCCRISCNALLRCDSIYFSKTAINSLVCSTKKWACLRWTLRHATGFSFGFLACL
jgi:hypothetical protein